MRESLPRLRRPAEFGPLRSLTLVMAVAVAACSSEPSGPDAGRDASGGGSTYVAQPTALDLVLDTRFLTPNARRTVGTRVIWSDGVDRPAPVALTVTDSSVVSLTGCDAGCLLARAPGKATVTARAFGLTVSRDVAVDPELPITTAASIDTFAVDVSTDTAEGTSVLVPTVRVRVGARPITITRMAFAFDQLRYSTPTCATVIAMAPGATAVVAGGVLAFDFYNGGQVPAPGQGTVSIWVRDADGTEGRVEAKATSHAVEGPLPSYGGAAPPGMSCAQ